MYPEPRHLAPWAPRTSWDGWFAICLFPPESEIRWLKAHFYRYVGSPGKTPIATVENFGDFSEMLISWGTKDGNTSYHKAVQPDNFKASQTPLRVEFPDHFMLSGQAPNYQMQFQVPGSDVEVNISIEAGWPVWMAKAGRFLHYLGQFSSMNVNLKTGDEAKAMEGTGTFEHVCGASLPFDFRKMLNLHWHFDVLAFHTPGSPTDAATGLSIGKNGKTIWRKHAAVRLPGTGMMNMKGLEVNYLKMDTASGPDGKEIVIPSKWEGTMKGRKGEFNYIAQATTPMLPMVPGGGFIGFDFEGTWTPCEGEVLSLGGTGFSEYGDFSGRLRKPSS